MVMPEADWLPFSETEIKVLRLLTEHAALSREGIATALDESVDGRLRGILATLVARHVLAVTSDGYRLNVADDRRTGIRVYLDSLGVGKPRGVTRE
jgi:hypothetical protein